MHAQLRLVRQDAAVVGRAVHRADRRADDADHAVAEPEIHEVRRAAEELVGERILPREIEVGADAQLQPSLVEQLAHDRHRVAARVAGDRRHAGRAGSGR